MSARPLRAASPSRARDLVIDVAIVAVATAARSIGLALDDQVLARSDLGTMFVPNYAWWWSGARWLGGWNRWILAGYPANADPLYGQLHPFGLLYASLPAFDAAAVEAALGPVLAAVGMVVYLCCLGCGRTARLVGALSYGLGGFVSAHAVHPPLVRVALAVPWALAAIESSRGLALAAALGAATTAILLAGHPQTALYALLLVIAYALWRSPARGARYALAIVAGLALGVVTAAASWLPAIGLVQASSQAVRGWTEFQPSPSGLDLRAHVVAFPDGGSTGRLYGAESAMRSVLGIEVLAYPGMVAVFAILIGLPELLRDRVGRFWLAAALVGVVLASGAAGNVPPLAGVRAPGRWLLWWNVAAAAGAGLALRSWPAAAVRRAREPRWWFAAAIVAVAVGSSALDPGVRRAAAVSATMAALAIVALRAGWLGRHPRAALAIVVVAALDLVAFASAIPLGLPRADFPDPGFPLRWLADAARHAGPDDPHARALVVPELRHADAAPFAGVSLVQGYSRLVPADFLALLLGPRGREPGAENRFAMDGTLAAPSSHVLDLLRCRLVACDLRAGGRRCPYAARAEGGDPRWQEIPPVAGRAARLFVNRRARPVAWIVRRARVVSPDAALRAIRDDPAFDPAREALVEAAIPGIALEEVEGGIEPAPVDVLAYADDEIRLSAAPAETALLVTSELAAPGWVAAIDGRPAPLYTVNGAFRAIAMPPGRHEIVLAYRPAVARVGLSLSALGCGALLACAFAGARSLARRRRVAL